MPAGAAAGTPVGTNCADPTPDGTTNKKNMEDSGCKNFCMANKNHKTCVDCTDTSNIHANCLSVNCKATPAPGSPKKDDSACKTYCKKNPTDCA